MDIYKIAHLLAVALKEHGDQRKVRRLWHHIGYLLAMDSVEQRDFILEAVEPFCNASSTVPHPMTTRFNAVGALIGGFRRGVAPLEMETLEETLAGMKDGSRSPRELFALAGSSLVSDTLEHLQALPKLRRELAVTANALEHGTPEERDLSLQIQTILHVLYGYEVDTQIKFCESCSARMREYWVVNPKPYTDGDGRHVRPYAPYKICETCKDKTEILAKWCLDSDEPHTIR